MDIRRIGPGDIEIVVAAAALFDEPPRRSWTEKFLGLDGHHLLMAFVGNAPVGMITGVETTHPDKGTEMFLYELSVGESHRRQGIARALTEALAAIARTRGCYGMWVGTDHDNVAAIATYRGAGGNEPEPCVTIDWRFAED